MVAILRSQEEMSHTSLLDMQKSIVLVCTPGPGGSDMLQQRMQIVKLLWDGSIGVEYLYPDGLPREDLEAYCASVGIQWMVIVKKHLLSNKGAVQIRAVKKPHIGDKTVSIGSLVDFFLERPLHSSSRTVEIVHGSPPRSSHLDQLRQFNVVILDQKHRAKDKQNRYKDITTVQRRVSKWYDALVLPKASSSKSITTNVLSSDLPFGVLREFGTAYMLGEEHEMAEVTKKHAMHKKGLKNIIDAVRNLQDAEWSSAREQYVILYSSTDDRYDMLSIQR